MYDLCVIGAGMIGSAAARHGSERSDIKVCLVGPEEPKDHQTADFYGAHYDEGRLTKYTAMIREWAQINTACIRNYRDLEELSGVKFYSEVGCLVVESPGGPMVREGLENTEDLPTRGLQQMSADEARLQFPFMHFGRNDEILLETRDAGIVNPRKFVLAEQTVARMRGCDVIRDVAKEVTQVSNGVMHVATEGGRVIEAKKVLVATGAFTEFRNVLPRGVRPDWELISHTVILAELTPADLRKVRKLPPMVYNGEACLLASKENYDGWGIYLMPPILYPDGKFYLKMGHHHMPSLHKTLKTQEEVKAWYRSKGSRAAIQWLTNVFKILFPELNPISIKSDTCVLVNTANNMLPYIDLLTPFWGVAIGGNGMAAKACDLLGKMAADYVITGVWNSTIPQEAFKLKTTQLSRI